ncbi:MAG TPA: NfeD family protein [Desulfomonilaceae bacterium]|nr:NfeD family protein [Desulfomonilaceae bacterium]
MESWWGSLTAVNKGFALAALFFSTVFLWQIVGMLLGIHGDSHIATDHGDTGPGHVGPAHTGGQSGDAHPNAGITFTLVSVRSVLAFATLFCWAGTLYLMSGISLLAALIYSFIWGAAALVLVAFVVFKLVQLQETGNATVWSAIGEEGVVYMDIPARGTGKIRVMVRGVVSYVNARSSSGMMIPSPTKVKVVGVLDNNTLEVETME